MVRWHNLTAIACLAVITCLSGCSTGAGPSQHYVSGAIQGESQKINLEAVQKAFFETKGKDFNEQMAAFEKRVNEIYDGEGVVALDATRNNNRLVVTGFISKSKDAKPGFQPGDDKLFTIEQTGDVVNNDMPYRMAGSDGRSYYEGHHSLLDSPLVQFMVLSHLMGGGGGWGGRYYTPYSNYGGLMGYRNTWRQSPQFSQQKATNTSFFSRFKSNPGGGLQSSTKFGGGTFSSDSGSTRRSWGGLGGGASSTGGLSTGSPSGSSFGWGGRRSSGFSMGGSRGWGGRRGR
ncbi:MAG: hypothetical protein KGS72_10755 [Cyanobacteria bacterium REEB67]|nr:hypothetical protein [Cyanobacteria bacterium REEB67]